MAEESQAENQAEDKPDEGKDKVDDILNTPVFLKRKLEVLKRENEDLSKQLEAVPPLDEEAQQWQEKIDRLQREFDMVRDRAAREMAEANVVARVEVLREVLTVTDNFDRARSAVNAESTGAMEVVARYDELFHNIQEVFKQLGMEQVKTVGEPFDPNLMEAVQMMPSDDYEEGVVMSEYQTGFQVGDKNVRPAYVVVSAG